MDVRLTRTGLGDEGAAAPARRRCCSACGGMRVLVVRRPPREGRATASQPSLAGGRAARGSTGQHGAARGAAPASRRNLTSPSFPRPAASASSDWPSASETSTSAPASMSSAALSLRLARTACQSGVAPCGAGRQVGGRRSGRRGWCEACSQERGGKGHARAGQASRKDNEGSADASAGEALARVAAKRGAGRKAAHRLVAHVDRELIVQSLHARRRGEPSERVDRLGRV